MFGRSVSALFCQFKTLLLLLELCAVDVTVNPGLHRLLLERADFLHSCLDVSIGHTTARLGSGNSSVCSDNQSGRWQ